MRGACLTADADPPAAALAATRPAATESSKNRFTFPPSSTRTESARRLQVHDPAACPAAGTVLVRDRTAPARPELPPDPLEVVHLEDEEGDDPEEDFGLRHAVQRIGVTVL